MENTTQLRSQVSSYFGYMFSTMDLTITVCASELPIKKHNNNRSEETKHTCYVH
jgi:hypothetical protein